jgi:predicted enzyme related to lactoylglutathione lyase
MGYPVVHFEINSSGAPDLVRFYADAFGWSIEPEGPEYAHIETEGVCPGSGDPGINGGIGPADPGDDFVTVYVQIPDVQEALDNVTALGGTVDMPATEAGRVVIAIFRDPAGNRIGLVRAAPLTSA